jgi:hypothetical protein
MTISVPDPSFFLDDGTTTYAPAGGGTAYGHVDGVLRVWDSLAGLTRWDGLVAFDVQALATAGGDEVYALSVQGSNTADFSGAVQTLATFSPTIVGQQIVPLYSDFNETRYRYFRLLVQTYGAAPSIKVLTFVQPLAALAALSLPQLMQVQSLHWGNYATATSNFRAWMAGVVGGGPEGDGRYYLSDGQGNGVLVLCPAAIADLAAGAVQGVVNFTRYRLKHGYPDTQAGHRATLDALMADDDVAVIETDLGEWSPHWSGTLPPNVRKLLRGLPGSVLKATDRTPILQCESPPVWVSAVSAITRQTGVNLSQDPAIVTSNTVDVLTLAVAHAVSPGDRVKVVANDIIPGSKSDSAGDRREGEFAIVALSNAADTTKITLTAPLRGTYTDTVRVALIPDSALSIVGYTLDADPALIGTGLTFSRAIRLMGMVGPRVFTDRSKRALATGIEFAGCFQPMGYDLDLHGHQNIPGAGQFGYGVVFASCEGPVLANSQFSWLRHPVDTATTSCLAGDAAIWKYGPTRDMVVANCTAVACQNGYSTHDEVIGALFIGNHAANFYQGAASGGAAYAMRGRHVRMFGNSDDNCRSGLTMSTIEGGHVSGHRSRNARLYGLAITGGTSTEPQDTRVKVEHSSFHLHPDTTSASALLLRPTASAVIVDRGAGYSVNDLITLVGGDYVSAAQLLVRTVDGSGAITSVRVDDPGFYNTLPANPAAVTGGAGTGATFNCAFKTAYLEIGEGVDLAVESTIDSQRVVDFARAQITGHGPNIDVSKVVPGGAPTGISIFRQQNYDDSLIRFDPGRGVRIKAGSTKVAQIWNGGVDGADTPFTNAHEFPDTYVEADVEIFGASTLNPAGIYTPRWPNLGWSLVKRIAGVTIRSDYIETGPTATVDLLTCKRLDRRLVFRITSSTIYAGVTLTDLDYTRLPRGAEVVIINSAVGPVALNGLTIPPNNTAVLQFRSNGAMAVISRTWSWPFRLATVRTGSYTTGSGQVGGLQLLNSGTAKTITPHATAKPGDRIYFENLGAGAWQFINGAVSTVVSPADFVSAPPFTRTGGAGTTCYLECVANADGASAAWVIGGTVAA